MTIDQIIMNTIGKEGKYSNNPNDLGGETIWGITAVMARSQGYFDSMKTMPQSMAIKIYRSKFLFETKIDRVLAVSPAVAEELFDTAVNMGTLYPRLWFQEWLNAFNRQGKDYADIIEDGDLGAKTIAAFEGLRAKRGAAEADRVMLKGLNASQGARYKDLARARQANEEFVFGWLANRVGF